MAACSTALFFPPGREPLKFTDTLSKLAPAPLPRCSAALALDFSLTAASDSIARLIHARFPPGREPLKFTDTLSKLRTDAHGQAIGMPARLDFRERVALGLRLHRVMQVTPVPATVRRTGHERGTHATRWRCHAHCCVMHGEKARHTRDVTCTRDTPGLRLHRVSRMAL